MAETSLKLQQLSIGDVQAIDLTVSAGHIVCISGPSGCGKSRLLRAIADLEPHQGEISLGELAQQRMPAHLWRLAVMLVQAESHWWCASVGEHFPPDATMPEALGLSTEVLTWPVSRLSSGEKQRLAVWRALSHKPRALLLDEPTANLDEASTLRIEQWLVDTIHAEGLPTIWVTHDQAQGQRVGNRRYTIVNGGLEAIA